MSLAKARILIALLVVGSSLQATTYFVDINGNNGNGLSWSNAKTSLASAISASSTGDEILVKYGSYPITNSMSIYTNRKITSDDGTASSFDTAQPDSSQCIMQGDYLSSRIFRVYSSNITNDCRIRGLKITGGNASYESYWAAAGGGLVVYDGASPIIEQCWITDNYGNTDNSPGSGSPGGAMFFDDVTDVVLRNCLVSNNVATTDEYYGGSGGGVYIDGSATLEGNIFRSNIAVRSAGSQYYSASGGAVLHRNGTLVFTGNLVEGNAAVSRSVSWDRAAWGISCSGGGVDLSSASVGIIRNNIFKNNVALLCPDYNQYTGQGSSGSAGALNANSVSSLIENNTFIGNNGRSIYAYSATSSSGALTFGTNDVVRNNIFVDNDDNSEYAIKSYPNGLGIAYNSFYDNSVNYEAGIISTNEILTSPEFVDAAGGNYALLETSPCIDAGDPTTDITDFPLDFGGGFRIRHGSIDIGAFEVQFENIPDVTSSDVATATEDQAFQYDIEVQDLTGGEITYSMGWIPSWLSLLDSSVVGMPLEGDLDSSFQVITYNGIAYASRIVELSVTTVNDPPVISEIADQNVVMNTPLADSPFTIQDDDTPLENLIFTTSSTNIALVPEANITLTGASGNYTVGLEAAPDVLGTSLISIGVTDEENTVNVSFLVVVVAPNSPPQFSPDPPTSAIEDERYSYEFSVTDIDGDDVTVESTLPDWLIYAQSSERIITTIAGIGTQGYNGDGIAADTAALAWPTSLCYTADGSILVADGSNYRIRSISPKELFPPWRATEILG